MTRTRLVTLMLLVALAAAACVDDVIIMGDPSPQVCGVGQCDTLEATVSSIDWLGDGTLPDKVESSYGIEPVWPLRTELLYEGLTDPEGSGQQTMARLRDAGFAVTGDGSSWFVRSDEWVIHTRALGGHIPPALEVAVDIVEDDARAAEILAPIVDALGTIP